MGVNHNDPAAGAAPRPPGGVAVPALPLPGRVRAPAPGAPAGAGPAGCGVKCTAQRFRRLGRS